MTTQMVTKTVTKPVTKRKSQKKMGPANLEPHIGKVPKTKPKPTAPSAPLPRFVGVYPGTMLMRRKEGEREVAPVYAGVDTLSFPDRQRRAFEDADKVKVYAVVVDGVLYPKINGVWNVWKTRWELLEYVLREKKLPEEEIGFRLAQQQFESAKRDLEFAFHWRAPEPEYWAESLKFHTLMLERACKVSDHTQRAKLERKVQTLQAAIAAQQRFAALLPR